MKRIIVTGVLLIILSCLVALAPATAGEELSPVTAYGDGPIEVRLYSNYFCPPCRSLEPQAEPLLLELVERNAIRLVMVDLPTGEEALLYAHFYFYALKAENTLERALAVRTLLFEAAARRDILAEDALAAFFEEHSIAYDTFDAKILYPRLNEFITEDKIRVTPTMVIVRDGDSQLLTGPRAILEALRALSEEELPEEEKTAE